MQYARREVPWFRALRGVLVLGLVAACDGDPSPADDAGADAPSEDAAPITCRFTSDCPADMRCEPGAPGTCVRASDVPVPCDSDPFPGDRDACDPGELPADWVCRQWECEGNCYPTCMCVAGRWQCRDECRDWFPDAGPGVDAGPRSCGTPPVCRYICGAAY